MKMSNADLALTDSKDSKRSICVTSVLLKIHIFMNHSTTTTNAKKKDLYQCRFTFHGIQSCTTGWCTEITRERQREIYIGAESRVSTLYDKMK